MDFLSFIFLVVSNRSQDWRRNHSWTMNPGHSFVEPDWPLGLGPLHARNPQSVISSDEI